MKHVPTLDIRRYDSDRNAFVAEIGAAYREFGFCCISGHGIARELIDGSYDVFRRFFALPTDTKMKYHVPGSGGARGYTPFKVETAKDSQYADLKEFWHIGREIPRDSKFAELMPPNLWPAEVPDFKRYGYGLYEALDQLGTRVLRALALHIRQPENFFEDKTDVGNSILRPIHYPPITDENVPNVRAGAHEDINFITLLVGASAEGLEVLTREGEWLPITTEGDAIVVNIGDMLQRLSNHVYPSTTHRVVNPPNENARKPRYSVPFFLHPNPDVMLDPL
ncbi:MAG: 2-oxoglutarate and iron-dependent oxygenase domain-containing protein, partial [Rhodanobacter sp.]